MKEKMSNMKVTAAERDLIEQIRNYNISYPNGYPELMWFVQETLDKMLKQPYEENKPLPQGRGIQAINKHKLSWIWRL